MARWFGKLSLGLGIVCVVAFVGAGLPACGAEVSVEPDCGVPSTGQACVEACEGQYPQGLAYYNVVMVTCACSGCSQECTTSVCDLQETPSDACLPCVQEALGGAPCNEHAGLFGSGCLGHAECADFVACVLACGPSGP